MSDGLSKIKNHEQTKARRVTAACSSPHLGTLAVQSFTIGHSHAVRQAICAVLCILGISGFLLSGCSTGGQTLTEDQNGTREKAPLAYYEATLRPSEFDEDVEIVRQTHEQYGESVTPFDLPSDSTVVETVEAQGFRIQVFASANIDEAAAARESARAKVGNDSVYVVYDPPVYKVRVGDYPTRLEANQRLPRIVNLGYPDAWVVSDKITLRRIRSIPRSEDE